MRLGVTCPEAEGVWDRDGVMDVSEVMEPTCPVTWFMGMEFLRAWPCPPPVTGAEAVSDPRRDIPNSELLRRILVAATSASAGVLRSRGGPRTEVEDDRE